MPTTKKASKRAREATPPAPVLTEASAQKGSPGPLGPHGQTRRALVDLLKRRGELDVVQLAVELGVSNVAVRQHLAGLLAECLVTTKQVRRAVGRPALVYTLAPAAEALFPQSSDRMALDLLLRLEQAVGPEAMEKLFQARMRDLNEAYKVRLADAKSWDEKLKILAQIRDEEGYLAEVQPGENGAPRLIEHHCPVAALAKQHPHVCAYELELFKQVLGEPGLKRCSHILSGQHACVYEVPEKPKKK